VAINQGLLDSVLDGAFPGAAITNLPRFSRICSRPVDRGEKVAETASDPELIDRIGGPLIKKARAVEAARACIDAVKATDKPFEEALAFERSLFMKLVASDESRALRYVFFAEREAQKVPGLPREVTARPVKRAAVIGAGTMGGGIAMCFANAGIPVSVIETDRAALDRGLNRIKGNYQTSVKRGSIAAAEMVDRMELITGALSFEPVTKADIVIEAVFEDIELKQKVFRELGRLARPGAVLASNTSYLDINALAAATKRPGDVLGTHFFSPANVMKLLEIVRGANTAPDTLATAVEIGRALGKVPVVVGVCDGFVGNRMLAKRSQQAERLLLEGALPQEVDKALTDFGFRMGPFAMGDLAGLDVSWRLRRARGQHALISDALVEAGRLGQKSGKGYYTYGDDGRTPTPDPEVEALVLAASAKTGLARRKIGPDEILERLVFPVINEGARILEEGIAARPGDIDVIWLNGYGWPANTGGPMFYADRVGLARVAERLAAYAAASGDSSLKPTPLLVKLAANNRTFQTYASLRSSPIAEDQVGIRPRLFR
jgi:3-hydroxyacyl-CoA dehydrogenase